MAARSRSSSSSARSRVSGKGRKAASASAAAPASATSHSADPSDPSDTSVRHAAPVASPGVGYPAGEYDVSKPAKLGAKGQPAVLSGLPALEALPAGVVIEREEMTGWRIHVRGVQRFGHGVTLAEALEDYQTGLSALPIEEHGARVFARLPKRQQDEIRARDHAVATRGTVDSLEVARTKAVKENGKGKGK